ncbi:MAG: ATP-binding cassette domain-containing protein [Gammaproteobacteria bacterium]|nr:ATP-binding cassette domain-containing protein [Gammaproteobacteria bacterium]
MDASAFLEVSHLNKQVPSGDSQITILKDVNLTIKNSETVAILGASGSGKTTLLTLLAGLDLPTQGDIYFQQHHLNALDEEQRALIRGASVGFIFQSFHLLPTLTALENVMLPLEIQYVSYERCKKEATEWLHRVGLSDRLNHYPSKLSGGEQQRVAIARAFINNPKIVFADEMTGNLDTHTGHLISDILFSLNTLQATTLVLVTHDETLASRCQRRLLLNEGVLQPC